VRNPRAASNASREPLAVQWSAAEGAPAALRGKAGGKLTEVFGVNGTRTSDGPGPGPKRLPADEASALIAAHLAIAGSEPPDGYQGVAG
jgi:hypothetical protein